MHQPAKAGYSVAYVKVSVIFSCTTSGWGIFPSPPKDPPPDFHQVSISLLELKMGPGSQLL